MTVIDRTADVLGPTPVPIRIVFGDERLPAYAVGADGQVTRPGVQVLTPLADAVLSGRYGVTAGEFATAADHLGVDPRWLINTACQLQPAAYAESVGQLATSASSVVTERDRVVLAALKAAVDEARALGPQAIVRAAVGYLARPVQAGGAAFGTLVDHVNRVLANPGRNARGRTPSDPINDLSAIAPGGLTLWWVKEGSATIVFQVSVPLADGRPAVRFVVNVAKDVTSAAAELRQTCADITALYAIDPASVMEPFGSADVLLDTWRGTLPAAALAAEWFDGHELHVYEGSSQLHVWLDQRMGREHPIAPDVSDRIWEEVIRMRARYTRVTPGGLVPIATHVNAGDYIFRERPDGEWDVLLIWTRRPAPGVPPATYLVLAALLDGVNVFGAEQGQTVWWDRPERALVALRTGLAQAGLGADAIAALLRDAATGVFATYADRPWELPYLPIVRSADPDQFRGVFARARQALAGALDPAPTG